MAWEEFPDSISGDSFPEKYNYKDNQILLKYSDGRLMRICNIDEDTYDKLQNLIQSRDYTELRMYVLRLVNKNSDDTQIVDLSHRFENFEHSCPDCDKESKFAPRSDPASPSSSSPTSAICLKCGFRLSVIRTECQDCGTKSYFVKPSVSVKDDYTCIDCQSSIL